MHADEATNAYILGQVLAGHAFQYDPEDRHGPALAAFTLPIVKLEGLRKFSELTEAGLRFSPVLAGALTIFMWGAGVELFGFVPCLVAALIFVLAPLPFYYNRYFIHESLFVAATLGLILTGAHALCRQSAMDAGLAGFCAAIMLAAKETAPLHFLCLMLAALAVWLPCRRGKSTGFGITARMCLIGLLVFLVSSILLFTWFGENWGVFRDLIQAVPDFTARAAGEGHEKAFFYYAKLLAGGWSGTTLLALGVMGTGLSLFLPSQGQAPSAKDLTADGVGKPLPLILSVFGIYGIAIFVLYSLIPYKTPWLALNFFPALALMSGVVVQWFWYSHFRLLHRVIALGLLLLFGALLIRDSWQRVFINPAGAGNPYAYAHTVDDLLGLPQRLAEISQQRHLTNPRIAVVVSDAWPLPWYLRQYSQVGFWQPGQNPGPADFFVTSPEAAGKMAGVLSHYQAEYFGLRPEVLIILWTPEPDSSQPDQP
jgi:uncharacterized protein (TIGR03663 family)